MKKTVIIGLIAAFALTWYAFNQNRNFNTNRNVASTQNYTEPWAYDPGPSPDTEMGRELIDIVASQPNMPGISLELTGKQKFRPAFGPTLWRMLQEPNSIKILFIGQDGTHIAEAAGRTATAGFGGRAQDMAKHFGVDTSAAFMNTFAYTIKGQYSGFGAPIVLEENGKKTLRFDTITGNGTWLMAQDQQSPMVIWRNRLIDWILRNNKDSMKLVVLFGGSAQDSIGTFIESRGGKVATKYSAEDLAAKKIKVPKVKEEAAGGNKVVTVAVDKKNRNIFDVMGIRIPYKDLGLQAKTPEQKEKVYAAEKILREAQQTLAEKVNEIYPQLAITDSGLNGSGIVHPAQIGGYDLTKIIVNGQKTISLKGLKLSDGSTLQDDILVAEFPHPTSLSSNAATASQKVEKSLTLLKPYLKSGWRIDPDSGLVNRFDRGEPYSYGRTDIGPAFYDFGTPKNRMVSVSSASRMSGKPNIVVIGTRDRVTFDNKRLQEMTSAKPAAGISSEELYSARPRSEKNRYAFDLGPGEKMARIMKENLNLSVIGKMKNGQQANESCKSPEPASQFNIKTHPICVGDFGHYRGTFDKPKVIILADPDGVDEIITSRALTGTRGQYLHGMMEELGVSDKYLVIKTVPFGMDGATDEEWTKVLEQTSNYRKKIFEALLKDSKPLVVFADGKYATQEISKLGIDKYDVPMINIARSGSENNSGIKEVTATLARLKIFNASRMSGNIANIPRSHLGFFSRVWEGTSGTRVLNASGTDAGNAFAIIVPSWVYQQKNVAQDSKEREAINNLKKTMQQQKLQFDTESEEDSSEPAAGSDDNHTQIIRETNTAA